MGDQINIQISESSRVSDYLDIRVFEAIRTYFHEEITLEDQLDSKNLELLTLELAENHSPSIIEQIARGSAFRVAVLTQYLLEFGDKNGITPHDLYSFIMQSYLLHTIDISARYNELQEPYLGIRVAVIRDVKREYLDRGRMTNTLVFDEFQEEWIPMPPEDLEAIVVVKSELHNYLMNTENGNKNLELLISRFTGMAYYYEISNDLDLGVTAEYIRQKINTAISKVKNVLYTNKGKKEIEHAIRILNSIHTKIII